MSTPDSHERNPVAEALLDTLMALDPDGSGAYPEDKNVVDALYAIAEALRGLTGAVHRLGTAGAATEMGALEVLSMEVKDGFGLLASAVVDLGTSIDGLADLGAGGTEGAGISPGGGARP